MSELTDTPAAGDPVGKKRGGGLSTMLIADLKSMAGGLGVAGADSMKKAQLIEAIKSSQSSSASSGAQASGRPKRQQDPARKPAAEQPTDPEPEVDQPKRRRATSAQQPRNDQPKNDLPKNDQPKSDQSKNEQPKSDQSKGDQSKYDPPKYDPPKGDQSKGDQSKNEQSKYEQSRSEQPKNDQAADQSEGEGEGRRNRRRRGRDRNRAETQNGGQSAGPNGAQNGGQSNQGQGNNQGNGQGGGQGGQRHRGEPDTSILDDDVLVPAAGILDVLDNYAFVRTSGYLAGSDDVYVSLSMVRKFSLRRGDAVMGQVRQPREGERKEKFNPMVRIDSVNGLDPESAKSRPEFSSLTALHPTERLRLETDPSDLIGRVIDLAAPIGKGQRGLIVSPARAGKTSILQSIARSVTVNNPECHLMVVLVDERPEEVTDFERTVKGEVVASTFDRAPIDHTTVAELAIERAKRLVELGHDVVVLLDGITRLARAYNLSVPSHGRALAGGMDSASLHPPKRFFGAARNIENGGSLTVVATATVESGSSTDEMIFEEFEGTDNMELRLRRDFADQQLFPAIDAVRSGTRHEELLVGPEELTAVEKLRRTLAGLDDQEALEHLLQRLASTRTNLELLSR